MRRIFFPFFFLSILSTSGWADNDWSYPFGDVGAHSFLDLSPAERNIQSLLDFQTIPLDIPLLNLLCGDVDDDRFQEVIGTSEDKKEIWLIDFMDFHTETIFSSASANDEINFGALIDLDQDQSKDIVFSVSSGSGDSIHYGYSVKQKKTIFSFHSVDTTMNERIYASLDLDYDNRLDLIGIGERRDSTFGELNIYTVDDASIIDTVELPEKVSPGNFAITQDPEWKESLLFLATEPSDTVPSWIHAYRIGQDTKTIELLWSQSLAENIGPSRLSIGKTINGDQTVIVGVQTIQAESNQLRSIIELDTLSGRLLNEIVIGPINIEYMSVGNLDDDEELEIVFLANDFNLHRIDFSQNRNRIMTLQKAKYYVGATELVHLSPGNENIAVQAHENKLFFSILSPDLNPILQSIVFRIEGYLTDRPILGDIDGNGYGEFIFVLEEEGATKAYRVFFYDSDIINATPTPAPIPTPIPTPTPSPVPSAVDIWKIMQ